jgi:hypothetical protein
MPPAQNCVADAGSVPIPLPSQLETEVVSLQHGQAQAAAKLQVSQEELSAARDQLLAARQSLAEPDTSVGRTLTQVGMHSKCLGIFGLRNVAM